MYSSTPFLNFVLDGMGDQHHTPPYLPLGQTRYHLYRRLGGPRAGLDGYGKSCPHWDVIFRLSIP